MTLKKTASRQPDPATSAGAHIFGARTCLMHGDRQVDLMLAAEHGELLEFYREISGAKG